MSNVPPILISLTSFGAAEVRRHGQQWFAECSHEAGADGVEVRGELLVDPGTEIDALARTIAVHGMAAVYSNPDPLWLDGGALNEASLREGLARAQALGASRLKMSIGAYLAASPGAIEALARVLAGASVELTIENDQTVGAGTFASLAAFFAAADQAALALPMTFDVGNWHYTGECPQTMARAFSARVRYVHCKGVFRQPQRWVAVPLAESAAPWRSILAGLPADVPWAIEYPLVGDDLVAVTRHEIGVLRAAALHQSTWPTAGDPSQVSA